MTVYENDLWLNDIDLVLNNIPNISMLDGKSVLVTGATGLICSSIVDVLRRYNEKHDRQVQVFAAGRSHKRYLERFGSTANEDQINFIFFDASDANQEIEDINPDYIIHGAGNAYPSRVMKEPVETMLGNFMGIKKLLDYARNNNTKKVLYISSSEVYGKKTNNDPFYENDYGFVDHLNSRNSYSMSKRATETLCVSYEEEYGINTVIVRPGHIYGPTASKEDSRVSSFWSYAAARGDNIIMKSDGSQLRSYCYSLDCASAILTVLLNGESAHAYNISNRNSIISIKELAKIISCMSGVDLIMEKPSATEKKAFNPMDNASLSSESLEGLGWRGCFNAENGIEHTIRIIKSIIEEEESETCKL